MLYFSCTYISTIVQKEYYNEGIWGISPRPPARPPWSWMRSSTSSVPKSTCSAPCRKPRWATILTSEPTSSSASDSPSALSGLWLWACGNVPGHSVSLFQPGLLWRPLVSFYRHIRTCLPLRILRGAVSIRKIRASIYPTYHFSYIAKTWHKYCDIRRLDWLILTSDLGYVGRIILHRNPWNSDGFKIQIVCIILAPTLICAGIYLTLKHVARTVGPELSRLKPRLYTWIFIPFDVFCLSLQAVGGGVDAAASSSKDNVNFTLLKVGNDIIIAGIVLQVVNLAVFGLLSLDFFWRARRFFRGDSQNSSLGAQIWHSKRFRIFCTAVTCAYAGILIRCIYRWVPVTPGRSLQVVLLYIMSQLTTNEPH